MSLENCHYHLLYTIGTFMRRHYLNDIFLVVIANCTFMICNIRLIYVPTHATLYLWNNFTRNFTRNNTWIFLVQCHEKHRLRIMIVIRVQTKRKSGYIDFSRYRLTIGSVLFLRETEKGVKKGDQYKAMNITKRFFNYENMLPKTDANCS